MRICSKCEQERDDSLFQKFKGRPSGQCRMCKTASEKARRARIGIPVKKMSKLTNGKKLCLGCDTEKDLSDFSPALRGLGGVSSYCRPCFRAQYAISPEDARAATKKYRETHRERVLANHRLHQFKRRQGIEARSDGTVTDAFLRTLYSKRICHYCKCDVPEEQRTADHCIALNKGGWHSVKNLVMACFRCNSSKRDLSEREFFDLLKSRSLV